MIEINKKRRFLIFLTILSILLSSFLPALSVFADDDANEKLNKEINEYLEDTESGTDFIKKVQDDAKKNKNPSKNTFMHILKRTFAPGEYLNDVEYGVLSRELGLSKSDLLYNDKYLCNPNAPNNLINHNCNIPNFTTDLMQTFMTPVSTPLNNAEKTSSYALFGFGVPKGIPGEIVPANPNQRTHTYTALELYGYNLQRITYNGEWDKIEVSSEARMLSNFGLIDKVSLMGTGLWNSVKSGLGALIENFSFNPLRWGKTLGKTVEGLLTGGINTVIDTSDMNIVATNRWKRSSFNGTLYNVYVLTDKEVLIETNKKYFQLFVDKLNKKADASPELNEVMALEAIPGFTFQADWETEESVAARESAEAHNAAEDRRASNDEEYTPSYESVPEPEYYTEKDQLGFWAEDNSDIINRAAKQGLISGNPDDYEEYEILVKEWEDAWQGYFSREFNALGDVVGDLLDESDLEIFLENPHLDPKQGISHYACANPDGTIMKTGGEIEYLYLQNNKGDREFINPKCLPARPPISAGLLGSGWHIDRPIDTRHIDHVSGSELSNGTTNSILSVSTSIGKTLTGFLAQLTNTVIGLAFSPILESLGITTIISELIASFRDTLFFPMAGLVAAIGAVLLFFKMLQNTSMWQIIVSIFMTFFVFVAGAAFLLHPELTIKFVDEVPTKIENFLADAVLIEDDGTSYCSTGGDADGIRSAQCNVWGAMVFNPWVHSQFGTKYENLFANGYAPDDGSSFNNTNSELVGNAKVDMGGGYEVHNWALYQLDKTKAGTINDTSASTNLKIGTVDKNLYRMVDLQAGPNNGAGTDPTHFAVWSGQESAGSLGFMFGINSILMAITLVSVSFLKIEASFIFALTLLFFPFMLLYGLLPQGKFKLKGYLSRISSLLLKRAVITVMLALLLKIYTLSYAVVDEASAAALISIAVSVVFLIYKKELLSIITATENSSEVKEAILDTIPVRVKQSYQMSKARVKGAAAGFVGASMGRAKFKHDNKNLIKQHENQLEEFNKLDRTRGLDKHEQKQFEEIKKELNKAQEMEEFLNDKEQSAFNIGALGARQSTQIIGRRTERSIRKQGFAASSVYSKAKDEVVKKGADSITNKDEPTVLDTYKEVLSHSQSNTSKTSQQKLTTEEARLLRDANIQKEVRRLAKQREKTAEDNIANKEHNALSPDIDELEKIAKYIDRKRKVDSVKGNIVKPNFEKKIRQENDHVKPNVNSNIADIIKEEKERVAKEKAEKETRQQTYRNNNRNNDKTDDDKSNNYTERNVKFNEKGIVDDDGDNNSKKDEVIKKEIEKVVEDEKGKGGE